MQSHLALAACCTLSFVLGFGSSAFGEARVIAAPHFRALLPPGGLAAVKSEDDIVINDRLLDRVFIDEEIASRWDDRSVNALEPLRLFGSDFDSSLSDERVTSRKDLARCARKRFAAGMRELGIAAKDVSRAMMEGRFNPPLEDLELILYSVSVDRIGHQELAEYCQEKATEVLEGAILQNTISREGLAWLKKEGIVQSFRRKDGSVATVEMNGAAMTAEHLKVLTQSGAIDLREGWYAFEGIIQIAKWTELFGGLDSCIGADTIIDGRPTTFAEEHRQRFEARYRNARSMAGQLGNSVLAYYGLGAMAGGDREAVPRRNDYVQLRQQRYLPLIGEKAMAIVRSGDTSSQVKGLPDTDIFSSWQAK